MFTQKESSTHLHNELRVLGRHTQEQGAARIPPVSDDASPWRCAHRTSALARMHDAPLLTLVSALTLVRRSRVPSQFIDAPAAYKAVQQQPAEFQPRQPRRNPHHYETRHYSEKWRLDMEDEAKLGIAPPMWSTTSQMNDPRPNGKSLFDARFVSSPMGRARGGRSMVWDPRGTANVGGPVRAENRDSAWFAADMADETAAGNQSAIANQYGQNTNLSVFDNADLALAQMSKLQKKLMDKDGDGQLSAEELRANGFDTDLKPGN